MRNAKIYKIVDDEERVFIGITYGAIQTQLTKLKELHNNGCHFPIFDNGNCRIELIEAFTCDNKEKHNDKLNYHIENAECINADEMDRMKDFLDKTKRDYFRAYYLNNHEIINEKNRNYGIHNIENVKEYHKTWRHEHQERIKNNMKQYQIDNVDKLKALRKIYYENNKDKIKEMNNKYRLENKDSMNNRSMQYYANNKQKCKEAYRKWREANKNKIAEKRKFYYENNK